MMSNAIKAPIIVLTKPEGQNKALQDLLLQEGLCSYELPCLVLEKRQERENFFSEPFHQDYWLFTSQNAVFYAEALGLNWKVAPQCIAIGKTTKNALLQFVEDSVLSPPPPYSSESLLAYLDAYFKETNRTFLSKKIVIFTGEGGRNILPSALKSRGMNIEVVLLYKRIPPCSGFSQPLKHLVPFILCISSEEALKNLLDDHLKLKGAMKKGKEKEGDYDIYQQTLIVSSQRLSKVAKEMGFLNVIQAKSAHTEDFFTTILQLL